MPAGTFDVNSPEYKVWYDRYMEWALSYQQQQQQQQMQQYQLQIQQQQQLQSFHQQTPAAGKNSNSNCNNNKFGNKNNRGRPLFSATPTQPSLTAKQQEMKAKASQFLPSSPIKFNTIFENTTASVSATPETPKKEKEQGPPASRYPPALKKYVTRNRDEVGTQLTELIGKIEAKNAIHEVDWDKMALPSLCTVSAPEISDVEMAVPSTATSVDTSPRPAKKRKKFSLDDVEDRGVGPKENDDSDVLSSLTHLPPHLREDELRRREERARRFKEAQNNEKTRQKQRKRDNQRAREAAMAIAAADGNPDVIDWDEHTIVGVCTKLEKNYLRLTSAPDPSTTTLALLGQKWKDESNYAYICDQFKSMRQDLTVQRIKNEFTVKVYEAHARIALEKGDIGEYNQCQAQLKELYKHGLPGCVDEFLGYRILYMVFTLNRTDQVKMLSELTDAEKEGVGVKHALAVRTAVATGNYASFFKLYHTAPSMSVYLMDFFVDRERTKALKVMCKAYRPIIEVERIARELGWVHPDDTPDYLKDALESCRQWLQDAGVPTVPVPGPSATTLKGRLAIECKTAGSIFSAKLNSVQKVDIKGQIH
ncbi:SAC3/GANP/Nin1/mts3/eIF-3 p25 family-domain-containing protein [Zopfochytrium polystomum]|nr:SAC3/GANP/Nin1/mts3/eIF-3 p25 family-domain-containing protein [Zopfochytrium polystomum]